MKGLPSLPTREELRQAYAQLQGPGGIGVELSETRWALLSQWTRFDPRLAEIVVGSLASSWERIHPIALHRALLAQPWPQAFAVLLEFVTKAIPTEKEGLYKTWKASVTHSLEAVPWQQFFIGQRAVGGQAMLDDARFASEEYRRWGFLARESLFPKARYKASLAPETRREILRSLLERTSRVTVQDYWQAIGQCVSLRQAERDLKSCPLLRARGRTQARFYVTTSLILLASAYFLSSCGPGLHSNIGVSGSSGGGTGTGTSCPLGTMDELVVANQGTEAVRVFNRTDNGNTAPSRVITGAATQMSGSYDLALVLATPSILVAHFSAPVRPMTFSYSASGNVAP